jgi:hypothetical protein
LSGSPLRRNPVWRAAGNSLPAAELARVQVYTMPELWRVQLRVEFHLPVAYRRTMRQFRASAFGLSWPAWVCLAAFLGLPASARALTLPVAPRADSLGLSLRTGTLEDGPSVWRLLNPSSPLREDETDWPPASPVHAGEDSGPATDPGRGDLPDSPPLPGRGAPDPWSHWPEQGAQQGGANWGGSSRPTGGDGPTQMGLSITPMNISLTTTGRLPPERMVLVLPEHASSVFRPPRP